MSEYELPSPMTSPLIHRALDRTQRLLARSPLAVRLAVLVRNQARCVIKYYLAESPDTCETGEVWLRNMIAPRTTSFVDVGSNVGDWLAEVVRCKGNAQFKALAFEPSLTALTRLRERFGRDARIEIVAAAAGDRSATMPFLEEHDAGRGSTLVPGFARFHGSERDVSVVTLDDELERRGWPSVDFLKIDAEGFDLRVMRGAGRYLRERRIGIVQFEYNRPWQLAGETLRAAYTLLEESGYHVFLLKNDGLFDLNYALYEEYFEYSNFVGVAPAWMSVVAPCLRGPI